MFYYKLTDTNIIAKMRFKRLCNKKGIRGRFYIVWGREKGKVAKEIGIRISGKGNKVHPADFLKASSNLLELLAEIDIDHTSAWWLKTLSYSSPATLVIEGEPIEGQQDKVPAIIEIAINGTESLKFGTKRPQGYSDKALELTRDLTKLSQNGVSSLEIFSDGNRVEYKSAIIENVSVILTPGKQIEGSIEGRIERMNSHGEFTFWIFEPILNRRITCGLMDNKDINLKDQIINLYEHSVIVSGVLNTNINGEVTEVKVKEIIARDSAPLLKDASEVTGIWDLTGGENPVNFIRRMRDGS